MKKALHDDDSFFFTFRKGELTAWSNYDAQGLLAAANDAPRYEMEVRNGFPVLIKDGEVILRVPPEVSFCQFLNEWMNDIVDNGITEELIEELNNTVSKIRYIHVLMLSEEGKPSWQNNIADLNRSPNVYEMAAFAFSHHLALGAFEGLKRCQLPDCQNFFIGRPNNKWCSKPCGSKSRVRRKRKRDLG